MYTQQTHMHEQSTLTMWTVKAKKPKMSEYILTIERSDFREIYEFTIKPADMFIYVCVVV